MTQIPIQIQLLPSHDSRTVCVLVQSNQPMKAKEVFQILRAFIDNAEKTNEREQLKQKLGISQ